MISQVKKLKAFSIFSFLAGFMTAAFLFGIWDSPGVRNVSAWIGQPDYNCFSSGANIIEWYNWNWWDPSYRLNTCLRDRGYKISRVEKVDDYIFKIIIVK
jgi:hypothetical protein